MKKLILVIDISLKTLMVILFVLMLGVTTVNVILRFFFSAPIPAAVEMGRYCFAGIIYLGAIYVMRAKEHIGLDMLVARMPKKIARAVLFIGQILIIIFLLIFSLEAVRMTGHSTAVKSSSMGIPMSIPYSAMVIGGIGMCMEAVVNFIEFIRSDAK